MQLDSIIQNLLNEFQLQRDEIKDMVIEIEKMRVQVGLLFPDVIDMRTRKFLEDKIKAMVGFYNVLLDMRKEISKSVKDELEFRRRLTDDEIDLDDIDELLDIGELSRTVEKFQEKKDKIKKKRIKDHKGIKELEEKGIDVPGLNELRELEEKGGDK
jgi:hypothetical protein